MLFLNIHRFTPSKVNTVEALLVKYAPEVLVLTECELEPGTAPFYQGYHTYEAANVSLVRTVAFVAAGLKHRVLPPLETPIQIVPLEITAPRRRIVLIGHYEQFQD